MISLLISVALAAPPAHYDPDRVASGSTVFRGFSEQAAPKFDALQSELSRTSAATAALARVGHNSRAVMDAKLAMAAWQNPKR